MIQAATELATEVGYIPDSETALADWMVEHRVAIRQRATKLQYDLLEKLYKPGVMERVKKVMCAEVWYECRRRPLAREANKLMAGHGTVRAILRFNTH